MTSEDGEIKEDGIHDQRLAGLRIAIDARTLRQPGMGIHGYLDSGVKTLVREGAQVVLLTNVSDKDVESAYPDARWESFGSRRDIIWDQLDLPKFLRTHDFQFYWAPGNNGVPFWSTGSTRTVCTTHDLIPLRFPRWYLLRNPGFALPYFVWTLSGILRSDVLLTVSESSARDIYRIFRRRSTVVSSALSLQEVQGEAVQLPTELIGLDYLVYTGGMDYRKNVRNLLAAFSLALRTSPTLRLVIIGHSTEALSPLIAALNLNESVILTGLVDEDVKNSILKSARALVYPSLYEGFGLPILEAFAAGVPVLTCRNSSLEEVASDAAVYVDPHSPASIAQGIADIQRSDVSERLRERGQVRLRHFDPATAQQQLVDVFDIGLISRTPRRQWPRWFGRSAK